jgi:hypothetical protein
MGFEWIKRVLHILDEHFHSVQKVYPTMADPIELTSGAGAWNLSAAFTEIVPINTITSDFDFHWVVLSNPDTNEDYEVVIYAVEVEIGRVAFTRTGVFTSSFQAKLQTPIIPANTQIQAKLADGAGGAKVDVKFVYHIY